MADIDYAAWLRFALAQVGQQTELRILELFSGHAPMTGLAGAAGLNAVALDVEPKMLEEAQGFRLNANALELPLAASVFNLALSTNASINYLRDPAMLRSHFTDVARVLKTGGAYVFDCCPPERAGTLHLRVMHSPGGAITFSHIYERTTDILVTRVDVSGRGIEEHRQRIYTESEITDAAASEGFAIELVVPNYAEPYAAGIRPIVTWVLRRV